MPGKRTKSSSCQNDKPAPLASYELMHPEEAAAAKLYDGHSCQPATSAAEQPLRRLEPRRLLRPSFNILYASLFEIHVVPIKISFNINAKLGDVRSWEMNHHRLQGAI